MKRGPIEVRGERRHRVAGRHLQPADLARTGIEADAGQPKHLAAEEPEQATDDEQREDGEESEVDDPSHGSSLAGEARRRAHGRPMAPGEGRLGAGGANLGDRGEGWRDGAARLATPLDRVHG